MRKKQLMSGNEAIGEAAIVAGCQCYFGYPITPQNELTAYMARRMRELGRVFLQSESELAAINMVFGAAACGARAMTSSSSPGVSLKQEGISYLAGAELPALIVNVCRGGPGLGNIAPAQSDYFQATKGGGHGDYHLIVLAPSSVPEIFELVPLAFDLAEKYRNPAMILADGMLGQMMEPVEVPPVEEIEREEQDWYLTGAKGREARLVRSLILEPHALEEHNKKLKAKYDRMKKEEVRYEGIYIDDAEILVVAYGTCARIAKRAVIEARQDGIKVGLLRPITLFPFPERAIRELSERVQAILVVEMSLGQMVEDVRLAVEGRTTVCLHGRTGGVVPTPEEVYHEICELKGGCAGKGAVWKA